MPAVIEPRTQWSPVRQTRGWCSSQLSCPAPFFNVFGWGLGPRYFDLAVATDLPFHKVHVCGEVFH